MKFIKVSVLLCFLALLSCSAPERPEFKEMKNVTARFASPSEMILSGISVYYNPNVVGGNLTAMDVNVWIDDIDVGKLDQELSVTVPGMDDFEVPFEMTFNPEKVFEQKGILGSILSVLEKKEHSGKICWRHDHGSDECRVHRARGLYRRGSVIELIFIE